MKYKNVKNTSVTTSELGFGTSSYNNMTQGSLNMGEFQALLEEALASGITHIDTARTYLNGNGEVWVGKVLKNNPHRNITIASKSHLQGTKEDARTVINESFDRLSVDYIDIYYIHWPKEGIQSQPMLEVLHDYRAKGLIGSIGLCNYSVDLMETFISDFSIDLYQFGYNLLWRVPELTVIPFCKAHNIELVTYSSLAQGLLTPREFTLPLAETDARRNSVLFRDGIIDIAFESRAHLKNLAQEKGISLQALAFAWLLNNKHVVSILFNTSTHERLKENLQAYHTNVDTETIMKATNLTEELKNKIPRYDTLFSK